MQLSQLLTGCIMSVLFSDCTPHCGILTPPTQHVGLLALLTQWIMQVYELEHLLNRTQSSLITLMVNVDSF